MKKIFKLVLDSIDYSIACHFSSREKAEEAAKKLGIELDGFNTEEITLDPTKVWYRGEEVGLREAELPTQTLTQELVDKYFKASYFLDQRGWPKGGQLLGFEIIEDPFDTGFGRPARKVPCLKLMCDDKEQGGVQVALTYSGRSGWVYMGEV